jgi:Bacteriocin-protection, YdeI or OmpD-Associated/Domain of unknown function (DUF1905)
MSSYRTSIVQAEGMTATGIPVPDSVVTELAAGKNPAVTTTVRKVGSTGDGYTYRISIATRNGSYIMSFSSGNRIASGLGAGDEVDVTVEVDTTPRTVTLPEDLSTALIAAGLLDTFLALSHSKQRAFVDPVEGAKAVETRQRRVEKVVTDLTA